MTLIFLQAGIIHKRRTTLPYRRVWHSWVGSSELFHFLHKHILINIYKVASNLVEPGENALVLHTGYFGDSFQEWSVKRATSFDSHSCLLL